jgi:hypothetical protein
MSALERWAARVVYLAVAPFVVVGGLLLDIYDSMVRVATAVSAALGHGDPELTGRLAVRGSFVVVSCGLIRAFLGDQ